MSIDVNGVSMRCFCATVIVVIHDVEVVAVEMKRGGGGGGRRGDKKEGLIDTSR
jgi:hypothetical protein